VGLSYVSIKSVDIVVLITFVSLKLVETVVVVVVPLIVTIGKFAVVFFAFLVKIIVTTMQMGITREIY
jgi:hypothetical protein